MGLVNVCTRSNMGRRQAQRKTPALPHNAPSWQDNNHFTEKRSQQRRKNNVNIPSTKCTSLQTSAQGTTADSAFRVAPSVGERREVRRPACRHREHSRGPARSKHGAAGHPPGRLSDSSPAPPGSRGPEQDPEKLCDPGKDTDSDRDLSDTERLPLSPSSPAVPPPLDLRPEVISPSPLPPDPHGPRGGGGPRNPQSDPFPDFLPPPFNAWSLSQLASCYQAEPRPQPRPQPRPPDHLERYLERLLQLEGRRLQTEEEEGRGPAPVRPGGPAPPGAAARLSCPRSILQCQRAFPLSFLSAPSAVDATLLSGCGCSQCRQRYAAAAAAAASRARRCRCPSAHAPPTAPPTAPGPPLPRRSHSETRARAPAERRPSRTRGRPPLSPARGGHQGRMQDLGNLRRPPTPGPPTPGPPTPGPPTPGPPTQALAPADRDGTGCGYCI
ncbi:basic proline-rich protein-like [Gadus morhua]|uniref:basic proline-rich protein-like n=1 Tax=Gadus morhua TaxID=8049 RepID=UPI0011B560BD|nr:basic proline-rich protein-like [Gadus morhua]